MAKNNNNNKMRIGVIGVGPVGGIIVAHLIEADAFVVACDLIPQRMDKIKKKGLILQHGIEKKVKVEEVCYSIKELEMYDLDLIIISVKTPALKNVINQLKDIKSEKLHYLVAQNGIDNEVEVASAFGDDKTMRMVVNFAGNMSDLNMVHVSFFNPPNYLAALMPQGDEAAKRIVELFNSVNLTTEIPEDILDYVWEKAILNAALSAVCAITEFPISLKKRLYFRLRTGLHICFVKSAGLLNQRTSVYCQQERDLAYWALSADSAAYRIHRIICGRIIGPSYRPVLLLCLCHLLH